MIHQFTVADIQSALGFLLAEVLSEVFFAGEVSLVSDFGLPVVLLVSLFSSVDFSFFPFLPA